MRACARGLTSSPHMPARVCAPCCRYLQPDGKSMVLLAWLVVAFVLWEAMEASKKREVRKMFEKVHNKKLDHVVTTAMSPLRKALTTTLNTITGGHGTEIVNDGSKKVDAALVSMAHQALSWAQSLTYPLAVVAYYYTTEVVDLKEGAIVIPVASACLLGIAIALPRGVGPPGNEWVLLQHHIYRGCQKLPPWKVELLDAGGNVPEELSNALAAKIARGDFARGGKKVRAEDKPHAGDVVRFTRAEWNSYNTNIQDRNLGVLARCRSGVRDYHVVRVQMPDGAIRFLKPEEHWVRRRFKLPMDYGLVHPMVEERARHIFGNGIIVTLIGAGFWITLESLCDVDSVGWLRVFPGHGLWHIFCSIGLTNALSYAVILHADDVGQQVKFVASSTAVAADLPEVYWERNWRTHEPHAVSRFWTFFGLGWMVPSIEYRAPSIDDADARKGERIEDDDVEELEEKSMDPYPQETDSLIRPPAASWAPAGAYALPEGDEERGPSPSASLPAPAPAPALAPA